MKAAAVSERKVEPNFISGLFEIDKSSSSEDEFIHS